MAQPIADRLNHWLIAWGGSGFAQNAYLCIGF